MGTELLYQITSLSLFVAMVEMVLHAMGKEKLAQQVAVAASIVLIGIILNGVHSLLGFTQTLFPM